MHGSGSGKMLARVEALGSVSTMARKFSAETNLKPRMATAAEVVRCIIYTSLKMVIGKRLSQSRERKTALKASEVERVH